MFRFGFKDRQREMLGLTITELRELKAELSDLREQLRQIIPGGSDDTLKQELPAGDRWDYADTAGGEYPGLGEDYFTPPAEDTGEGQEVPRSTGLEIAGASDVAADDSAGALTEAACGIEEVGEMAAQAGKETVQQTGEGSEESPAVVEGREKAPETRREWAVVNYCQEKKPWWKLWGRRGRVYGDYSGGGPQ